MHNSQKLVTMRCAQLAPVLLLLALVFLSSSTISAQPKSKNVPQVTGALTRTTIKHEARHFGYGNSLTIIGAPAGSITIEAWQRSEVDITADIELHADTEADLALLAAVNSFTLDEGTNHLSILTTGMHDKVFMRRVAKKFPKTLLGLPWKVDYHIRVPPMCDLEIDAGRGAIHISGVEGALSLRALESDATLELTGGAVNITVGGGSVNVRVATRSWRGAGALIQIARGELNLELPAGFNADINADVLISGQIENTYTALVPQERTAFTPRSIHGRAGSGGATLAFKVTEGTLRIKKTVTNDE
ncbi:MAG TPA: hypothetical protein VGN95_16155 [Pyrinomonadaceae bacterium]|jgi:hypothetical protein|nr:hypothetical protein [Pyrinomonadaceae bacterium]